MGSRRSKPKMSKRTKFTIVAVLNLTWYTVVVLISNFFDHTVASELTIAWFTAWTVELGLLFGIEIKKKSYDENLK